MCKRVLRAIVAIGSRREGSHERSRFTRINLISTRATEMKDGETRSEKADESLRA